MNIDVTGSSPGLRGLISAEEAERLAREQAVGVERLMMSLLPRAAQFAKPPVSQFSVGAIARGASGALYFGANVEFRGEALSFTVHAEQSAIANAWMHGESGVDRVAVTAVPCGYCRQFMNELATADGLTIQLPNGTHTLQELLPHAFGPRNLAVGGGLMQREEHALEIDDDDELAVAALRAARMSYAPYSKSYAGVALRSSDGTIAAGAYAENAAFNPSMSPLAVALSQLNLQGRGFDSLTEAVLVRVDALHTSATLAVLGAVSRAPLRLVLARNSG
jgi:cytidine deaminase